MRMHKAGIGCIAVGAVLIALAVMLLISNKNDGSKAGKASESVMELIRDNLPAGYTASEADGDALILPEGTFNVNTLSAGATTAQIDGYDYIGYLSIPILGVELPVMSDWDYTRLRIAPCRQFGSIDTGDLVIAAHNYNEHFGRLHNLEYGDLLVFTDMGGLSTAYAVTKIEILQPEQVDEMKNGDWDLTLYTCTYGGQSRVAARFSKIDPDTAESIIERYACK